MIKKSFFRTFPLIILALGLAFQPAAQAWSVASIWQTIKDNKKIVIAGCAVTGIALLGAYAWHAYNGKNSTFPDGQVHQPTIIPEVIPKPSIPGNGQNRIGLGQIPQLANELKLQQQPSILVIPTKQSLPLPVVNGEVPQKPRTEPYSEDKEEDLTNIQNVSPKPARGGLKRQDSGSKKNVSFTEFPTIINIEPIKDFYFRTRQAFNKVENYINSQIQLMFQPLEGKKPAQTINIFDSNLGNTVLIDGPQTTQEHENVLHNIMKPLENILEKNRNSMTRETKMIFINELDALSTEITKLKDANAIIMRRIGENGQQVYDNIVDLLKNSLVNHGIAMHQAYETIKLLNPAERTTENIISQCEKLSAQEFEEYKHETEFSKKIRQVGFILRNEFGKKMYDAFLGDFYKQTGEFEFCDMIKITPQEAQTLNLDFGNLIDKLIPYMTAIQDLKNKLK